MILVLVIPLTFSAPLVYGDCFHDRTLVPGETLNFTSPVSSDNLCTWEFRCPGAESLTVKCSTYSISGKSNCIFNFFLLSDGKDSQRYCGNSFQTQTFYGDFAVAIFQNSLFLKSEKNSFLPSRPKREFPCQVTCNTSQLTIATATQQTANLNSILSPEAPTKCACGEKDTESRIINGHEASLHEFPWQVVLRDKSSYTHYCGGTLICNKYVLTASHCVDNVSPQDIVVSLGDHNKIQSSETDKTVHSNIVNIITHEKYYKENVDNDIALLELSQTVVYNEAIIPVCLPFGLEGTSISGKTGTVTGWGTTSLGGSTSEVLNELETPLLTTEECRSHSKYGNSITNNMICAYNDGKGDSCQGDSGGPLTIVDEKGRVNLVGVVSWGIGCSLVGYPGVYTKVTNYLDWIEEKAKCDLCGS